jgi:N-acetylglutamate synthase-like GNAT family acetyltransferase
MRIRQAARQDAGRIAALAGQLGYELQPECTRTRLDEIARDAFQAVFVVEGKAGSLIGWVHVYRTDRLLGDPMGEIGGIVVDENHRGMGVGTSLLERSEEWAQNVGCTTVKARSNTERLRTPAFYRRAGYSLVSRQNVFVKEL